MLVIILGRFHRMKSVLSSSLSTFVAVSLAKMLVCDRHFPCFSAVAKFLLVALALSDLSLDVRGQQQNPFEITGGSVLAMAGKDSVAIAVDKRFGSGPQVRHQSRLVGADNCSSY